MKTKLFKFFLVTLLLSCLTHTGLKAQLAYRVKGNKFTVIKKDGGKFVHHIETNEIFNLIIGAEILDLRESQGCIDSIILSEWLPYQIASYYSLENTKKFKRKKVHLAFNEKEMYDLEEDERPNEQLFLNEFPELLTMDLFSFSVAYFCVDGNAAIAVEMNDEYQLIIYNLNEDEE
jgi:hypothetical protein